MNKKIILILVILLMSLNYLIYAENWQITTIEDLDVFANSLGLRIDSLNRPEIYYTIVSTLKHGVKSRTGWHFMELNTDFDIQIFPFSLTSDPMPAWAYNSSDLSTIYYVAIFANNWFIETAYNSQTSLYVHDIEFNSQDTPYILYTSYTGEQGSLNYVFKNYTGWQVVTVLDSVNYLPFYADMTFDSNNKMHIVFVDQNDNGLVYGTKVQGQWSFEKIPDAFTDYYPNLDISPSGKIGIAFINDFPIFIENDPNSGADWQFYYLSESYAMALPRFVYDSNNIAHIGFSDDLGLAYAKLENQNLNVEYIDQENFYDPIVDIGIDEDGYIHMLSQRVIPYNEKGTNSPQVSSIVYISNKPTGPTPTPTPAPTPTECPSVKAFFISNPIWCQDIEMPFTDLSQGAIESWYWDFGDGSSSSSQFPTHTYTQTGTFTVTLTVIDTCGHESSYSRDVVIKDCFGPPWNVGEGLNSDLDDDYITNTVGMYIHWEPIAQLGTGVTYRIERSTDNGNTWQLVADNVDNSFVIENNSFPVGTKLLYRVQSLKGQRESEYAYTDTITVVEPPCIGGFLIYDDDSQLYNLANDPVVEVLPYSVTPDVTHIMISEYEDFHNAQWRTYTPGSSYSYTFENITEGVKVLYIKVKNQSGRESPVVTNKINQDITAINLTNVLLRDRDTERPELTDELTVQVTIESDSVPSYIFYSEDPNCEIGNWYPYSIPLPDYTFKNNEHGIKTLYVKVKDLAGNESNCFSTTIYYYPNPITITNFSLSDPDTGSTSITNKRSLLVNLDYTEGIINEIRIWEGDTEPPNIWKPYQEPYLYSLAPGPDGNRLIHVQVRDALGRVSNIMDTNVILDTKPPQIMVAGYWDTYLSTSGGTFTLMAYVLDENIDNVELYYDGNPTGVYLNEDETVPGLFSLVVPIESIPAPMQLLLSIKAVDLAGQYSDEWPFLNINPGPKAREDLTTYDFENLISAIRKFMDYNFIATGSYTIPQLMLGGYWDTNLNAVSGGLLRLICYAVDPSGINNIEIFYNKSPTGVYLYDTGDNGDWMAGDNIWTFYAELSGPLPAGKYLIELKGKNQDNLYSDLYPYLTVHSPNEAPDVTILSPSYFVAYNANEDILFSANGFDPETGDLPDENFIWYVDGNAIGTGKQLTYSLPYKDSDYEIMVVGVDPIDPSITGNAIVKIRVEPQPLEIVELSAQPTEGSPPLTVLFTSKVTGGVPPYRYSYNFQDGTWAIDDPSPQHTFYSPGTYNVLFEVWDRVGNIERANLTINVANQGPIVIINSPQEGASFVEGEPIYFIGQALDPEGNPIQEINMLWNSNVDGQFGSGKMVITDSLTPSDHLITLEAIDPQDNSSIARRNITIEIFSPALAHNLYYDSEIDRVVSWVLLSELKPAESIKWMWYKNGELKAEQTFTATQHITLKEFVQHYPLFIQPNDTITVKFYFNRSEPENYREIFVDSVQIPSKTFTYFDYWNENKNK